MAFVFLVIGALVVFVIAAVLIGREAARLSRQPPRPVFDMDEAVVWLADRLPLEVTAELSHAELRQILTWSVEHLRLVALEDRLAEEAETVAYVVARSGGAWPAEMVAAVLVAQAEYLEIIGAAGQLELPPDPES